MELRILQGLVATTLAAALVLLVLAAIQSGRDAEAVKDCTVVSSEYVRTSYCGKGCWHRINRVSYACPGRNFSREE